MKTKIITMAILCLIMFSGFLGVFDFENENDIFVKAATLYVGGTGPNNYTKVQDAIDNASARDTVRVFAGTYNEKILIDKELSLIGNSPSDTIINMSSTGITIKIISNWVNVSGFTIRDDNSNELDTGIRLENVQYCTISKNIIQNKSVGIYIDTYLVNDDNDYYIDVGYDNISGNWVYNFSTGDGKFTPGVVNVTKAKRVGGDIIIRDTGPNLFKGTWDTGDTIVRDPLAEGDFPSNDALMQHYQNPGTPGRIDFTAPLIDEEIQHSYSQSLVVWADDDGDWDVNSHDTGKDGQPGTSDPGEGDRRPTPGEKYVDEDLKSPKPKIPSINRIENNTLLNNEYGIYLKNTYNNSLKSNIIQSNLNGIYSFNSNNNTISRNLIYNNSDSGICFDHSERNLIIFNSITKNYHGINFLMSEYENRIYLNDFIDNYAKNVIGTYYCHIWNSSLQFSYTYNNTNFTNNLGNYWDDYTGIDIDGNGIGDTSYNPKGSEFNFSTPGLDNFPLMKPIQYYTIIPSIIKLEIDATYSNSTNETVFLSIKNSTLSAEIRGQLNGTINFTDVEMVIINSSYFTGKGFFFANWTATIEGKSYHGTWKGMLFKISKERKILLKGTLLGGLKGITEGFITESKSGSGTFDCYNSNWTLYQVGNDSLCAKSMVNGTLAYQSTKNVSTNIYILQIALKGNATGYYNKSLDIVLTHVRINNQSNQFHGLGFSIITYISVYGTGQGWTYDKIISENLVKLTGFFTESISGIIIGKLNDDGSIRSISLKIKRMDIGLPPRAIISLTVWGPKYVSPGETVNYFLNYRNSGLKNAKNIKITMLLSKNAIYQANTGSGSYSTTKHEVTWFRNISAKSQGLFSVKCKIKWGLPQGTILWFNGSIRDYYKHKTLTKDSFKSIVVVAKDPNIKYGPDGNVSLGQKLNYSIEFENEGTGSAYGVYFSDTLSKYLDDSTLEISPVLSTTDRTIIGPPGIYNPCTRTIIWFLGELGPHKSGFAKVSINVKDDLPHGTEILNYATVYFPSVPEITRTNGIVSRIKINQGPIAVAGNNKIVDTYQEVLFDGSKSFDKDGIIINYTWDFGDGNFSFRKLATYNYSDDGDYTVTLTVTDDDGAIGTDTCMIKVNNVRPIADFTVYPETGNMSTIFEFTSKSMDTDGIISKLNWDFGDGSTSTQVKPNHQYQNSGTFTVTLVAQDDDGADSQPFTKMITLVNLPPIAVAKASKLEAEVGENIIFDASESYDLDGVISSLKWDFGDGAMDFGESIKHSYNKKGTFTVTLFVTDDSELSASTSLIIIIHEPPLDSDGDNLPDELDPDDDNDGLPDIWEEKYGFNTTDPSDVYLDIDNDNLNNFEEYFYKTDPTNSDTDGDGLLDGEEIKVYYTNATNPDTDGDNYNDKIDAYPNDPSRYKKESAPQKDEFNIQIVILIFIIVSICLIVIIPIVVRKRRRSLIGKPYTDDPTLYKLSSDILVDLDGQNLKMSRDQIKNMLQLSHAKGEISEETYKYINDDILHEEAGTEQDLQEY